MESPFDHSYTTDSRDSNPKRWRVGEALLDGIHMALLEMRDGSQGFVVCSPAYAYGELGIPPRIPPHSTIVFDLRVVRVENEFCSTFVHMDINDRARIPIHFIAENVRQISDGAKGVGSAKIDSVQKYELAIAMLRKTLLSHTEQAGLSDINDALLPSGLNIFKIC